MLNLQDTSQAEYKPTTSRPSLGPSPNTDGKGQFSQREILTPQLQTQENADSETREPTDVIDFQAHMSATASIEDGDITIDENQIQDIANSDLNFGVFDVPEILAHAQTQMPERGFQEDTTTLPSVDISAEIKPNKTPLGNPVQDIETLAFNDIPNETELTPSVIAQHPSGHYDAAQIENDPRSTLTAKTADIPAIKPETAIGRPPQEIDSRALTDMPNDASLTAAAKNGTHDRPSAQTADVSFAKPDRAIEHPSQEIDSRAFNDMSKKTKVNPAPVIAASESQIPNAEMGEDMPRIPSATDLSPAAGVTLGGRGIPNEAMAENNPRAARAPNTAEIEINQKLADKSLLAQDQIDNQLSSRGSDKQILQTLQTTGIGEIKSTIAELSPFSLSPSAPAAGTNTPSAAPITAAISAQFDKPAITALAQTIVKTLDTQKGVSVRLDPPEMGRVYIDYQFDRDNSVTALLRADLPDVLAQLRDNSSALQELLKQSGFTDVNISFEQNSSGHDQTQNGDYDDSAVTIDGEHMVGAQTSPQPSPSPFGQPSKYTTLSIDIKL